MGSSPSSASSSRPLRAPRLNDKSIKARSFSKKVMELRREIAREVERKREVIEMKDKRIYEIKQAIDSVIEAGTCILPADILSIVMDYSRRIFYNDIPEKDREKRIVESIACVYEYSPYTQILEQIEFRYVHA